MTHAGVILYGPPTSGKSTVTQALHALSPTYTLFQRIKVGTGRTDGYRLASATEVEKLRQADQIVWENHRYGNTYVVDRPALAEHLAHGVPVLHLGQVEAVHRVTSALPEARWLTVYLWCPRSIAEKRISARGTGDTEARLKAWDETDPLQDADVVLDTSLVQPHEAAREINHQLGFPRHLSP
ncbi:guanylate kinase [Actinomadura sp. 6N118]|uniref:phosphotransferase-like protein n=1 Tax=Actinomadura sp. 6N118 TaxID=3375151 RepID=UPI0037936305